MNKNLEAAQKMASAISFWGQPELISTISLAPLMIAAARTGNTPLIHRLIHHPRPYEGRFREMDLSDLEQAKKAAQEAGHGPIVELLSGAIAQGTNPAYFRPLSWVNALLSSIEGGSDHFRQNSVAELQRDSSSLLNELCAHEVAIQKFIDGVNPKTETWQDYTFCCSYWIKHLSEPFFLILSKTPHVQSFASIDTKTATFVLRLLIQQKKLELFNKLLPYFWWHKRTEDDGALGPLSDDVCNGNCLPFLKSYYHHYSCFIDPAQFFETTLANIRKNGPQSALPQVLDFMNEQGVSAAIPPSAKRQKTEEGSTK